ncbi:hypothetical protein DYU11_28355 [Fibrisoma montanum]|uniref:pPIWI-RE three-gene island domain-containing protein n=1 Tax=Fibrisoma montanum TaxID=2305895 RepID=A0A418LYR4_9BACT|nr:hypothetical protein [Fibrisoma montanum]RIV18487.1 hypothetical protein DYU11_28355 [Fibrisoma montanum]
MNTALTSAYPAVRPALSSLLRWQEPLATRLRNRHALPGRVANRMLNVELGLYLLSELLPTAPQYTLPDLLNGQGAAYRQRPPWTPRQHRALSQARILLAPYRDREVWYKALDKYATLPGSVRLFTRLGGWNPEAGGYVLRERLALFRGALV